jgi:hypothetical protein
MLTLEKLCIVQQNWELYINLKCLRANFATFHTTMVCTSMDYRHETNALQADLLITATLQILKGTESEGR